MSSPIGTHGDDEDEPVDVLEEESIEEDVPATVDEDRKLPSESVDVDAAAGQGEEREEADEADERDHDEPAEDVIAAAKGDEAEESPDEDDGAEDGAESGETTLLEVVVLAVSFAAAFGWAKTWGYDI